MELASMDPEWLGMSERREALQLLRKFAETDWQQIARERTADVAKADAEIERLKSVIRGKTFITPTAPEPCGEPVAWVPVHPRNGPLWANCIPTKDSPHPAHYPLKPLYERPAQPPALLRELAAIAYDTSKAAEDRIRDIQELWEGATATKCSVQCMWRDGCRLAGVCEKEGFCHGRTALGEGSAP